MCVNQSEIGVQAVFGSYTGRAAAGFNISCRVDLCFCTVMDMVWSSVHPVLDLHKTRLDSGVIQSHTLFMDLHHNHLTELNKLG